MKPAELYKDFADFSQYVDGLSADTTLRQLQPSIKVAASKILDLISVGVYIDIVTKGPEGYAPKEGEISTVDPYEALRTAIASLAMCNYQIFSTVKKNGSEASIYKYQHEEMKKHYLEAFWSSADELLTWLDEHPDTGNYKKSEQYQLRQELPIKSAKEFDKYFQIGKSAYFFSRVIYIIRDSWGRIKPVLGAQDNEEFLELAKKSCCYDVMAKAVTTFDVDELPRSIRLDSNHEFTKDGGMAERKVLAAQYSGIAKDALSTLQANLRGSMGTSSLDDFNDERNKFFML